MALYAAMLFLLPLLLMAAAWEGVKAIRRQRRAKREWKYIRETRYPRCEY